VKPQKPLKTSFTAVFLPAVML